MTFQKHLIILSIYASLTACGSSDNAPITAEPVTLTLSMPSDDAMLQEDFPIAHHLTYTQDQQAVDSITSIDVNWPDFDVYQVDKELGYIDGASVELFYSVHEPVSDPINKAVDLERQDQHYWFVNGNEQLHRLDKNSRQLSTWNFADTKLTELSIDQDDASQIWLYNMSNNQLIHFDSEQQQTTRYQITYDRETSGSIYEYDVQGIYYDAEQLYVISEKYTKAIQISLTGEIVNVFDLDPEDLAIPSDIVVKDSYLYVTGDHENDEPTPPISVFEIINF